MKTIGSTGTSSTSGVNNNNNNNNNVDDYIERNVSFNEFLEIIVKISLIKYHHIFNPSQNQHGLHLNHSGGGSHSSIPPHLTIFGGENHNGIHLKSLVTHLYHSKFDRLSMSLDSDQNKKNSPIPHPPNNENEKNGSGNEGSESSSSKGGGGGSLLARKFNLKNIVKNHGATGLGMNHPYISISLHLYLYMFISCHI